MVDLSRHFLRRLWQTPLLLGWIVLGPLVALRIEGWMGFLLGLATGVLTRAPPVQVLTLYGVGILVNALPEELYFRGFLLPRLEKAFDNPLNGLVLSALLFNALHVPIEMSHGASPLAAVLGIVSIGYPSGLIWGYLYLRTRSILPGTLWHAANGKLGFLMMDL
jgi:membrane protease YdiL (CAAX protease family)